MAIGQTGGSSNRAYGADEPVKTVVSKAEQCVIAPSLIQYHKEKPGEYVRGQEVSDPIMTLDAANRYGLTSASLTEWHGTAPDAIDLNKPLRTQLSKDHEALTLAHMTEYYGNAHGGVSIDEPLRTQTTRDREAVTLAHMAVFKGRDKGQKADIPLRTVTTSAGEFGAVHTHAERYADGTDMRHWPEVRELLNRFCGYRLADDEVLLLDLCGGWYFIADIGLRMLSPRELFDAMGFPHDYIIDRDAEGKAYSKSAQVARCGNAVCPPVAAALIKANAPESAISESVA